MFRPQRKQQITPREFGFGIQGNQNNVDKDSNGGRIASEFMKSKKGEVVRELEYDVFPNDKTNDKVGR